MPTVYEFTNLRMFEFTNLHARSPGACDELSRIDATTQSAVSRERLGSQMSESVWLRRYRRIFTRLQRAELIDVLVVRTGLSAADLQEHTLEQLQQLLDRSRHELVVEEDEAAMLLDPNEMPRVRDFLAGEETARTLLDGLVPVHMFLDCFLLWSGDANRALLRNGRNLRGVVETIRLDGGLGAAARRVPWLSSAVDIADHFSLDWLRRRRIFVRHAMPHEALSAASTCARMSQPIYIEEGQHRAIAAAWTLTRGGTAEPSAGQGIAYLRGVNRRGAPGGDAFWQVHGTGLASGRDSWRLDRHPMAEFCSGVSCVLLAWYAAHLGCRRRRVRRRHCERMRLVPVDPRSECAD